MEYFIKYHDDTLYYKVAISEEVFYSTFELLKNIGQVKDLYIHSNNYLLLDSFVYTLEYLDVSRRKKKFRMYPLVKMKKCYISLCRTLDKNKYLVLTTDKLNKYMTDFIDVKNVNRMLHTTFLGLKQKEYEELNPFMDDVMYFTTNKDEALHREKFINSAIEDIEYAKYAKIATKCQWTIDPSQRICNKCICESCIDRSAIPDIELIKKGLNSKYQVFSRKKRF